jgi:hypothetical protein
MLAHDDSSNGENWAGARFQVSEEFRESGWTCTYDEQKAEEFLGCPNEIAQKGLTRPTGKRAERKRGTARRQANTPYVRAMRENLSLAENFSPL